MIPIDNSDLAWLVTADYNQDHGIIGAEELRDDILNPDTNQWVSELHPVFKLRNSSIYAGYGGGVGNEYYINSNPIFCSQPMLRGNTVGSASEIGKLIGGT